MSKKKTGMEMVRGLIELYITAHPEAAEEIEEIVEELDPCVNCEVHYCNDCPYRHDNEDCCELDDEDGDHKPIEDLSKFITSVGTVLSGNMGLLVFDKSNKKDMEKLATIFKDYAERL